MLKHYAPRAKLLVFQGRDRAVKKAMREAIARHQNVGVMAKNADAPAFAKRGVKIEKLGRNDQQAAKRLFAAMRALDRQGVDLIIARAPQKTGLGLGCMGPSAAGRLRLFGRSFRRNDGLTRALSPKPSPPMPWKPVEASN